MLLHLQEEQLVHGTSTVVHYTEKVCYLKGCFRRFHCMYFTYNWLNVVYTPSLGLHLHDQEL